MRSQHMDTRSPAPIPPEHSAKGLLASSPMLREYALRDILFYVQTHYGQADLLGFLTSKLGPCTSVVEPWSVWSLEDYTVYATSTDLDLDTSAQGLENTLRDFRWDLGLGHEILARAEWKQLRQRGRDLGLTVKYLIPSMPVEDLRRFVNNYCDGQILCDHQVRDKSLLGMVFMPLALGALHLRAPKENEEPDPAWVAENSLREDIGPEPTQVPPPPPPKKPDYHPEPPRPSDRREPDPQEIESIKTDIEWEVSSPERLENYLEVIRLHNVGVDYHHAEALAAWERSKRAIDRKHRKAMKLHEQKLGALKQANREFKQRHHEWTVRKARQDAALQGFKEGWLSDLGVLYEFYSQAGPRSINGYPCFFSFRILNKADWDRVRPAIQRELEHRKNMEI